MCRRWRVDAEPKGTSAVVWRLEQVVQFPEFGNTSVLLNNHPAHATIAAGNDPEEA
jgi:hypothetical protein